MSLVVGVEDNMSSNGELVTYCQTNGPGLTRNMMDVLPTPRGSSRWRAAYSKNQRSASVKMTAKKRLLKKHDPVIPRILKFFQMIMTLATILCGACSNWTVPGGVLIYHVFVYTCTANLLILVAFFAANSSFISSKRSKQILRNAEFCYYAVAVISLLTITASVYKISYNLSLRVCSLFGAVLVVLHVLQFVFVFPKEVKQLISMVKNRSISSTRNNDKENIVSATRLNILLSDHFFAHSSYTEISQSTLPLDTEVSTQQVSDKILPNTIVQVYTNNECMLNNEVEPITSVEVCNAKSRTSWSVFTTCILNDDIEPISSRGTSTKCILNDRMEHLTSVRVSSTTCIHSDEIGVINEVKTEMEAATKRPPHEHNTEGNQKASEQFAKVDHTLKKAEEDASFPMQMGDSPTKLASNQQPFIPNPEMLTQELVDELIEADPLVVLRALEEVSPKLYSSIVGLQHGDIESSLTARHVLMLYQTVKKVPLEQLAMAIRRSNNNQYQQVFWSCMIKQRQRCRLEKELETASQNLIVDVINKMGKEYALKRLVRTHPGKVAQILHDFPPQMVEDILKSSCTSTLELAAEYVPMPALNEVIRSIPFDSLVDVFKPKSSPKLDLALCLQTLCNLYSALSKVSLNNMSAQRANDLVSILVDTCPQSFLHTLNLVSPQATFLVLRNSNINIQLADMKTFDLLSAAIEDTAANDLKRSMSSLSADLKINTLRSTPIHLVWDALRCYSSERLSLLNDMDDFEAPLSVDDDSSESPSTENNDEMFLSSTKSNETIVLVAKASQTFEDDVVDPTSSSIVVAEEQASRPMSLYYQKIKTMEKVPTFTTCVMERRPPPPPSPTLAVVVMDEGIGDSFQQHHQDHSLTSNKRSSFSRKELKQAATKHITVVSSQQDTDDRLSEANITTGDAMLSGNESICLDDVVSSAGPTFIVHKSTTSNEHVVDDVEADSSENFPASSSSSLSLISFGTFTSDDFVLKIDKSDQFNGDCDDNGLELPTSAATDNELIEQPNQTVVERFPNNPNQQHDNQVVSTPAISLLHHLTKRDRQAMRVCFPPANEQTENSCNKEDEEGNVENEIEHTIADNNCTDKRNGDEYARDRILAPRTICKGSFSAMSSFIGWDGPQRDKFYDIQRRKEEQKRANGTKKLRTIKVRPNTLPRTNPKQARRREEGNIREAARLLVRYTTCEDFGGDHRNPAAGTNIRLQNDDTNQSYSSVSKTINFKLCDSNTNLIYNADNNVVNYKRKQKSRSHFEKYTMHSKNTSSLSSQTYEQDATNQRISKSYSSSGDEYMSTIESVNTGFEKIGNTATNIDEGDLDLAISTSFIWKTLSRHRTEKIVDETPSSSLSMPDNSDVHHIITDQQGIPPSFHQCNEFLPGDMLHMSLQKRDDKSSPEDGNSSVGSSRTKSTVKVGRLDKEQKSRYNHKVVDNERPPTILTLLEYLGLDPSQMRNFDDLEKSLHTLDMPSVKERINTTIAQEQMEEMQMNVDDLKKIFEDAYQFFLETQNETTMEDDNNNLNHSHRFPTTDSSNPYEPEGRTKNKNMLSCDDPAKNSSPPECSHKQHNDDLTAGFDTVFDGVSRPPTLDDFIVKLGNPQLKTEKVNNNSNHEWDILNALYPVSASSSADDQPSIHRLRSISELDYVATGDGGMDVSDLSMGGFILP